MCDSIYIRQTHILILSLQGLKSGLKSKETFPSRLQLCLHCMLPVVLKGKPSHQPQVLCSWPAQCLPTVLSLSSPKRSLDLMPMDLIFYSACKLWHFEYTCVFLSKPGPNSLGKHDAPDHNLCHSKVSEYFCNWEIAVYLFIFIYLE